MLGERFLDEFEGVVTFDPDLYWVGLTGFQCNTDMSETEKKMHTRAHAVHTVFQQFKCVCDWPAVPQVKEPMSINMKQEQI